MVEKEQGRIKWFNVTKRYGFISPESGPDVFVHINNVVDLAPTQLVEGLEVEFVIVETPKGLEAQQVRAISAPGSPMTTSRPKRRAQYKPKRPEASKPQRFLNPYNFVRYLTNPRPKNQVLGDCLPPPHDRYVGLTGRITCTVEAVTPLFVSDSHDIEGEVGKHREFRFFQVDGEPVLPASSLRGMIRSVFEAATNSCFAILQEDDPYPLEHREARAPDMIPARVVELTENGGTLELLDCTYSVPIDCSRGPVITRAAAVAQAYPPRVLTQRDRTATPFDSTQSRLPQGVRDGMRVAALVTREPQTHRSGRFRSFIVQTVVPVAQHTMLRPSDGQVKVFGWLHLTGPNIENKHDERLFFRWDDRQPQAPTVHQIDKRYLLPFSKEVVSEYNYHLAEYWERNRKQVEKLGKKPWLYDAESLPYPSTFVEQDRELQQGDLVYALTDNSGRVSVLRSVTMPRIRYRHRRQELLPETLLHCRKRHELCPACRMFGWVHPQAEELGREEAVAYAGRVRLSHGCARGGMRPESFQEPFTLAILATPKPTTTVFYLLDANLKPSDVTYDTPGARLRGRKFYRHFGEWERWLPAQREEFKRAGGKRDDQNRTIRGVLKPGAKFTFDLEFESLTDVELGAVLWALELEDGMYHRLGFAKPLGFGSVKVTVDHLRILKPGERYTSLRCVEGGWTKDLDPTEYINAFKAALQQAYDEIPFIRLPNIQDLRKLLSAPDVRHIHYPRSEPTPTEDGENFKWFVGNRRRLDDARKPAHRRRLPNPELLPLPSDDTAGLELMDARGNAV